MYYKEQFVSGRIKRFVKLYARMLINNNIDYKKACNVYKRNEAQPEWTVKRLLRRKEVQNMLSDEIAKIYEAQGITPQFVIDRQKEVLRGALKKLDYSNANRVLESFKESLGMNQTKLIQRESFRLESNISYEEVQEAIKEIGTENIKSSKEPES